jgi:hypothetical protein
MYTNTQVRENAFIATVVCQHWVLKKLEARHFFPGLIQTAARAYRHQAPSIFQVEEYKRTEFRENLKTSKASKIYNKDLALPTLL